MSSAQLDVKNALGPQSAGAKKVRRNPPLPAGSRPKKNPNPVSSHSPVHLVTKSAC